MGKINGFQEVDRLIPSKRPVETRINDYKEINIPLSEDNLKSQGSRCMSCGVPFCNFGCPTGNLIPDFNHMVFLNEWEKAYDRLSLTSTFPEFTGRVCPALCEGSCTLGINRGPVTIQHIEYSIIERAYKEGWVIPEEPKVRTNKNVAVVGSGPAGLAAAKKLNSFGHTVTVYEKDDEVGGLLRYGIPDFKLEKDVIDRRVNILKAEGVTFICNTEIGEDISLSSLKSQFDAVVLTGGCQIPRDLNVTGRELDGVHYAMEYLTQQNRKVSGKKLTTPEINAKDKVVIVIGGGDTGSDCIGTAKRQGCKEVYQYEILPKPPVERDDTMPWPEYPRTLKTSTSHEEGCNREWCVSTKSLVGSNNKLEELHGIKVEWTKNEKGNFTFKEVENSEFVQKADLVLIAMGFTNPILYKMVEDLNLKLDSRGNLLTNSNYMTSYEGIFAAGDMRTGQSLVVRAIADANNMAEKVDDYLMNL